LIKQAKLVRNDKSLNNMNNNLCKDKILHLQIIFFNGILLI